MGSNHLPHTIPECYILTTVRMTTEIKVHLLGMKYTNWKEKDEVEPLTINSLLERVHNWPSAGRQSRTLRVDNIRVAESLAHNLHRSMWLPCPSRAIGKSKLYGHMMLCAAPSPMPLQNPTRNSECNLPNEPFSAKEDVLHYSLPFPKSLSYLKVES